MKKIFALIFLGTAVWSLTMIKSGLVYDYGMGFWGPNGHDGVWHIFLINSFANGLLEMPVFAGEVIKNYHMGYDLLLAFLHKLTGVSAQTLYFQIAPPVLAALIGLATFKFVKEWRRNKKEAFWATFFVYFGAGWGWLVSLLKGGELGGESTFWSQQSISTLVNPPFATSLVLMLLGLTLYLKYRRKSSAKLFVGTILTLGILSQIKVYGALLIIAGLLAASLWELFWEKKVITLKILLPVAIINLLVFLPTKGEVGSIVVFKPFWFLETMMGLSDRLGWERFYSAMTNYRLGGLWVKATAAYLVAFVIFVLGNLGTRILALPFALRSLLRPKSYVPMEIAIYTIIAAGIVVPTLFLQSGTPWNTIQFLYYSLMFTGILAGVALAKFATRKSKYFVALVVLLTIPTTIGTLRHYLPGRPPATVPSYELEALSFLSQQPRGVVLTYPFDQEKAKEALSIPPRPLTLYESTAYVAAFGEHPVFLEDEVNLNITNFPWPKRREEVEAFLETSSADDARSFLKENKIAYVYWLNGQRAVLGETQLGLEQIFENAEVKIYKVN